MFSKLFKKMPKKQVGVEITPEGLYACFVNVASKEISIERFAHVKFTEHIFQNGVVVDVEKFTEILKQFAAEQSFSGMNVSLGVSSNVAFIKTISLPNLSDSDLAAIIPQEADKHIPTPVDEVNLDYEIVRNGKNEKVTVILAALSKNIAKDYEDAFTNAGLKLSSIDITSFAMIRSLAFAKQLDGIDGLTVSVLVGFENTDITIVQKGMPLFTHNMPIGKKNLLESLSFGLEISFDDAEKALEETVLSLGGSAVGVDGSSSKSSALVKNVFSSIAGEVQKTIEFFLTQNSQYSDIKKIFIGGWGLIPKNADKFFTSRLKIETELGRTVDCVKTAHPSDMLALVGLGIKE